jgi:hypothetical protein
MTYKKGWLEQDSGLQYNRNSQTLEANKLKAGSGVSIGNISNDPVLVDSTATLKTEFAIGTNVDRVDEKIDVQNEPTGITPEQRAVTTIDFDSTARTFTIAPTGGSFQYWDQGVKYIKYGPQSVQFPDVEGLHFFFFEGPSLGTISSFDESLLLTKTYLAVLYWDADNQEVIYFGDERHTPQMPGRTHLSLHLGIGTVYISGLALTGIVADASGALDSHAQFGFSSGIILDEDLQIDITSDPTPSLTKIYYKEGAAGNWRCDCPVNFPVKNFGAGRVAYNMMSGGTWQQFQADEGAYTLSHIFATNDTCCKLIVVQGQSQYTSLANAREAANEEILNIATEGLPFEEFVSVGTIIFQTSNSYGNSVKARAITTATGSTYVDFRGTRSTGAITTAVTQHNTLGGREDPSSHPAEAISYEDGTTQTTVQLKMEELDSSIGTHPVTAAGTDNASWSVNQDASALGTKFTSSAGVLNIQRQDGADINIEHDGRFKSDSYQLDTQSVTLAGDTLTASGAQAFILVRGEGFNDDDLDRIVLSGIPERTPIYLYGQGTETITIKHDNYVGNGKIITPTGEDVILGPGDTVQLIENSTGTQYNVIGISQAVSASEVTVDNSQFINFLIDSTSNDVQGTLEFIDLNVNNYGYNSIPQMGQFVSLGAATNYNKLEALDIEKELDSVYLSSSPVGYGKTATATCDNGNIITVWRDSISEVKYSVLTPDGTTIVNDISLDTNSARGAGIALLNNGYQAGVIVPRATTTRALVYYKIDVSGNLLSGPTTVYTYPENQGDIGDPLIKTLPNGNLVVSFKDGRQNVNYPPVAFVIINEDGEVIVEKTNAIPDNQFSRYTGSQYNNTVLPNGNIVFVWIELEAFPDVRIKASMFDQDGNELIGTTVLNIPVEPNNFQSPVKVLSLNNGNFAVLYRINITEEQIDVMIFDQTFEVVVESFTALQFSSGGVFQFGKARLPDNKFVVIGTGSVSPYSIMAVVDYEGNVIQTEQGLFSESAFVYPIIEGTKDGRLTISRQRSIDGSSWGPHLEKWSGTGTKINGYLQLASGESVNTISNSSDSTSSNALMTSSAIQNAIVVATPDVVFTEDIDSNIIGGTGAGGNLVGGSGLNNFLGGVSAGSELTTGDENVIIGNAAVQYNQTGSYNVVIGRYAGRGVSANSYSNNIIVGFQSGYLLTTGGNNVLVGYQAGYSNTTQSDLIAIGYQAGYNSTGITNMFIGTQAGFSTVSGQRNTIIGYLAGYRNTGSQNTILGREAGYNQQSGLNNVFLGVNAGAGVGAYSASQNTFVGHSAGSGCTANNNVFVGYLAGQNAGAGGGNTGVGYRAAIASGTGSYFGCTAVGYDCCSGLTSGSRNTAMGYDAFGALQTGEYNVGVGYQVGRANVTSGSYNTLIGYEAGYNMAAASSYNVFLGYQAGYSETGSNKLHIANNSTESLIEGDFSARTVKINGDLTVETLYADASSVVIGTTVLSEKSGGGILINDQEIEVISGIHTLPSGDSTSSIIFETPMENSNYAISASISNEVDETPSIYSFIITNKSTTGFNVLLSGNLDSGNYKLEYMVKKDPYIS